VFARRIVTLFGLSPHFAGIYGADLAGTLDDKVKLLRHLADREGVDTSRSVMIGDRSHDIRAARLNGARAVGVTWGYGTPEELAGADALADSPPALVGVLRDLPPP
jgi:phosphoglycolate phosphatase